MLKTSPSGEIDYIEIVDSENLQPVKTLSAVF